MEQHAIPQNVTQYQFRLIGNLTLKQFAMLGACILAAFLLSKTTILPVIFRYPLIGLFVALGLGLAFLPFEERSLDVWLINFIKSIYSPTQYLWRTSGEIPDYLSQDTSNGHIVNHPAVALSKNRLQPYLQSIQKQPQNPIDTYEQDRVGKISNLFYDSQPNQPSQQANRPVQTNNAPTQFSPAPFQNQPQTNKPESPQNKPIATQHPIIGNSQQIISNQSTETSPIGNMVSATTQTNPPIQIMSAPPIGAPLKIKSLKPDTQKPLPPQNKIPIFTEDQMPPTPDLPNTIVGAVMTPQGQLLPNAIIEICDNHNLPVRAIKSNRLGQFFIATPLASGTYTMIIEHETHSFDTITIEAAGGIIAPLKIISK